MAYVRQQSRWRRNYFVERYALSNKQIVWKEIMGVGKHSLWLALPLLIFPLGVIGWIAWCLIWFYSLVQYTLKITKGRKVANTLLQINIQKNETSKISYLLNLPILVIADSLAVIHSSIFLIIPNWQYRW